MGYLGNPKLVVMSQDSIPIANFEYPADPTPTTNPVRVPVSWLNTVTGMIWICTDNTTNANVWVKQGPETSDREAFTPSVTNSENITWTAQKWREGKFLHLDMYGLYTGAWTGVPAITLPDSLQIDNSVLQSYGFHMCQLVDPGNNAWFGILQSVGATSVQPITLGGANLSMFPVTASVPFSWSSGDEIVIKTAIPIKGW